MTAIFRYNMIVIAPHIGAVLDRLQLTGVIQSKITDDGSFKARVYTAYFAIDEDKQDIMLPSIWTRPKRRARADHAPVVAPG